MAKPKYTVTFKGQTFTRDTKRTYSHVIVGRRKPGEQLVAMTWCGRPDLANKEHDKVVRAGWKEVYSVDLPQP